LAVTVTSTSRIELHNHLATTVSESAEGRLGHAEREGLRRSHDHQELPGRVQQESSDRCCQGRQLADTAGGRCQQRKPVRQANEDACIVDQRKRHEAEPELGGTADGTAGLLQFFTRLAAVFAEEVGGFGSFVLDGII
jgi:hypothetical protein